MTGQLCLLRGGGRPKLIEPYDLPLLLRCYQASGISTGYCFSRLFDVLFVFNVELIQAPVRSLKITVTR